MKERLRRRVAELGYECSLQESCVNIAWLYLLGSFDPRSFSVLWTRTARRKRTSANTIWFGLRPPRCWTRRNGLVGWQTLPLHPSRRRSRFSTHSTEGSVQSQSIKESAEILRLARQKLLSAESGTGR